MPVLRPGIAGPLDGGGMERILVALDGSEHSDKALDLASDLAGQYAAELILLHVLSDKPLTDAERHLAEVEYLDDLLSSLEPSDPGAGGDPRLRAQRVLQHYADVAHRFREAIGARLMSGARARAREKGRAAGADTSRGRRPRRHHLASGQGSGRRHDLFGSRGLGDVKGLLMGSVSHKVAHLADCTCVAVK